MDVNLKNVEKGKYYLRSSNTVVPKIETASI